MRAELGRVMAMVDLVIAFIEVNLADDQGVKPLAGTLSQLRERGRGLIRQQRLSSERSFAANQARAVVRGRLTEGLLRYFVSLMERAGSEVPELRGVKAPWKNISTAKFVTAATDIIGLATTHRAALEKYGLTQPLIDDASKLLAEYVDDTEYAGGQTLDRVEATNALESVRVDLLRAIRELDRLNRHRYANDPGLLAKWNAAKKVVGPAVRSRPDEPPSGAGGDVAGVA